MGCRGRLEGLERLQGAYLGQRLGVVDSGPSGVVKATIDTLRLKG